MKPFTRKNLNSNFCLYTDAKLNLRNETFEYDLNMNMIYTKEAKGKNKSIRYTIK